MDLSSGYPFWLIRDGLPFDYPMLDADIEAEVIVLGGGISGALAAWHLSEAGIDTIVVDKRSIGLGSTCASTALLQYEIDTPLSELQHKTGLPAAVRSYKLCEESIGGIAAIADQIGFSGFEFRKSLYFAASEKDNAFLQREYKIRKEHGFDLTLLNRSDIKNAYRFDAGSAILSQAGAQIDAYRFTHALLQYSIPKGLRVFDRTEIKKIVHGKDNVRLKTAAGIQLKARYLVYATGYEVQNYIDKKIVNLDSTYAIISEQANGNAEFWKEDVIIWNTADPYLYMRNTSDRRILVGGRDEKFSSPHRRDKMIKRKKNLLTRDFQKLFPSIPFKPEFSWTGTFGSTADGLPFIGPYKKLASSFFALGFGGNGITFSQIAAVIIRDAILGKKNPDMELFSFERI